MPAVNYVVNQELKRSKLTPKQTCTSAVPMTGHTTAVHLRPGMLPA